MIRDTEVTQAVGRLRAVNRDVPVRCVILSDAVVNYPVKLVRIKPTLWACDAVGAMLERGGVAFLSPSQASAAYPDLYASKQAAAKVFEVFDRLSDTATFSIEGLYGKGCPVVLVKRPRGKISMALVHPSVADIEATIKALIPGATVKHQDQPAEAPKSQPSHADTPPAVVVDLAQARNTRADRVVDGYFAEALIRARPTPNPRHPRPSGRKVAVGGSDPVVAVSVPLEAVVVRPHPRLIWALEDDPKPWLSQPFPRRYAVDATGVELVPDRTAEVTASAGAALVREAVAAWQTMTATDPEAWT